MAHFCWRAVYERKKGPEVAGETEEPSQKDDIDRKENLIRAEAFRNRGWFSCPDDELQCGAIKGCELGLRLGADFHLVRSTQRGQYMYKAFFCLCKLGKY